MRRTEPELPLLICVKCERSDELAKDALCVWCRRCGPSYPVRLRGFEAGRALLAEEKRDA